MEQDKIPFFSNPMEALAWMQRNGKLKNQFDINPTLDWDTTNQMIKPQTQDINSQSVPNQGITLTEEQLNDDRFVDPSFTDPELLERMEQNRQETQQGQNGNFQFYNPYGGFDLPTSTFKLGQSVQDKNTAGIVAGGAKVGLSLARNFLGGMAYNKQNKKVMERFS